MRLNRIYLQQPLSIGEQVELPEDAVRHLVTVLRMSVDDTIVLFNGDGNSYIAKITCLKKKQVSAVVEQSESVQNESGLSLHLYQGVSRGDKMDFTLQKAVELGVHSITPMFTERCGVKLAADRLEKKMRHWSRVIISACEQSGRNRIPTLKEPVTLLQCLDEKQENDLFLLLDPHNGKSISSLEASTSFHLLIGPEGGLSDSETELARSAGCVGIQMGPRILRTETAGLACLSVLQARFGDF